MVAIMVVRQRRPQCGEIESSMWPGMAIGRYLQTVVGRLRRDLDGLARWAAMSVIIGLTVSVCAGAQATKLAPGPTFTLIDQHGRAITAADLGAKPSVIHFGFTRCPVICPTTLYELAGHMRELGPLADEINVLFVTVDPDRDTPSFLAEYIESFDRRIIGLSGDASQIAALAAHVGATYTKVPTSGDDYTMEHSVNAFLVEAGWRQVSLLYMGDGSSEAKVMQALRNLVGSDGPRKMAAPMAGPTR